MRHTAYPFCSIGIVALFALVFTLSGCEGLGDSDDYPENIAGGWTGTVTDGTNTATIALNLVQSSNIVTGTFSVTGPDGTINGTISGSYFEGDASLNFIVSDKSQATLTIEFEKKNSGEGTFTSDGIGISGKAALIRN